jgi:hypothetical protein
MLGKIIWILLFLGCKDVKSTNSSNGIVSSETVKKEGEISFEKQFFKYDSCNISEGKSQVFLFKKKDEINEVIVEIFNKNNSLIDSTRLSLVDNPSIKLHCEEGSFALEYENNIGNNYNSVIHKFDWNNVTESFYWSKTYNIESTRQGISIKGNILKRMIPFQNYTFEDDLEMCAIYSFSGYQEEETPVVDDYYNLIKLNYNSQKQSLMNLYGDRIVLDFILDNIEFSKENLTKYNDIAYYLEQSKEYDEAVFLLEKIINVFPDRTVAYLNLGDAYWGLGNTDKAKKAYKIYFGQMKESRKGPKIPYRVLERMK